MFPTALTDGHEGLQLVDAASGAASNDEMADHPHDPGTDVLSTGREPPCHPERQGRFVWLLVFAEAAALAGLAAVALHYRAEAGRLQLGRSAATSQPMSSLPHLTSDALRLPADGSIAGTVLITAAAQPAGARARFTVSALITGGRPDTVYYLTGNDCSSGLPDHVWAAGRTDAAGTAELTGHAWTGAVADQYWLALAPSPASPPPGLRGPFAQGTAAPFHTGQAPCAPSP
jgi:hypothetical protein